MKSGPAIRMLAYAALGMVLGGIALPAQKGPGGGTPSRAGRVLPEVDQARAKEAALKGLRGERRKAAQLEAAKAWARAAEAQKGNPSRAARARLREAVLLGLAGDAEGAEAAWKQVLQLDPDRLGARALVGLADLARRGGKTGKALELYQEAVKRFPKSNAPVQEALVWVGKIHMRAGRMDKAREAFEQVARVTGSAGRLAYVYDLIVRTWLRQGNLEKAEEAFREAKAALDRLGRGDERKARAAKKALEGMRSGARIRRARRAAGKGGESPGKKAPEKGGRVSSSVGA